MNSIFITIILYVIEIQYIKLTTKYNVYYK